MNLLITPPRPYPALALVWPEDKAEGLMGSIAETLDEVGSATASELAEMIDSSLANVSTMLLCMMRRDLVTRSKVLGGSGKLVYLYSNAKTD